MDLGWIQGICSTDDISDLGSLHVDGHMQWVFTRRLLEGDTQYIRKFISEKAGIVFYWKLARGMGWVDGIPKERGTSDASEAILAFYSR